MTTELLGKTGLWTPRKLGFSRGSVMSGSPGLGAGEGVDGRVAVDLLGEAGFWDLKIVFWASSDISVWSSLEGEKADAGAATGLLGEIGIWILAEIVFSGDALLVCFAFLLRYLGLTLSSQYECHCCAVWILSL